MKKMLWIFLLQSFLLSGTATADKLLLEGINTEPPNTLDGIPRPNAGMTAERVEQVFGKPRAKSDPVGKPAISRWVYDSFIVVFENDRVIHSVVKKAAYSDLTN
ncbi:MAG: hypothetical protein OEZ43_10745 [Gammaproteobacteria bacterium]|nr:hypothetical protein [Gammaproteobacteria bacterium]